MSNVSKVNKKNTILKESNNKMSYVNEIIKKYGFKILFFYYILA